VAVMGVAMASLRFCVRNQIDHDVKPCNSKLYRQLKSDSSLEANIDPSFGRIEEG
jgi:hypothetical protein